MGLIHRDEPHPLPKADFPERGCGTVSAYQRGCRCDDCKATARIKRNLARIKAHNRRVASARGAA